MHMGRAGGWAAFANRALLVVLALPFNADQDEQRRYRRIAFHPAHRATRYAAHTLWSAQCAALLANGV